MVATRAPITRRYAALLRPSLAARRCFAHQQSPTTPQPQSPASTPSTAASPDIIPIPQQRRPRKLQDGYSGAFYLSLLGGLLLSAPVITYFYWEHRKVHMREKKEAILHEIHARVGVPK